VAGNKAVAYLEPDKVEVQTIDYPKLELQDGPGVDPASVGRKTPHGAILKIVATNICGSDQHMVRGRTTAPAGLILGHEITGEVIEAGPGVEFIKQGDLVSVPFNIACGRCRMCKEGNTGVCLNVNPSGYGAAYGYVGMGGWRGGQAEYVMTPYADWNLLKFEDPHGMLGDKRPIGAYMSSLERSATRTSSGTQLSPITAGF
jgi:glutathione-independent formaldehyde dehydrogenase